MPLATIFTRINDSLRPSIGTPPGKLRLVFVSEQAGGDSPPLSPLDLSDLRIFTGARIIYALTAAKVAGAVTQTAFYDYRVDDKAPGKHSHFGAPVSSVEILLRDTSDHKTTDELAVGEVSLDYFPYGTLPNDGQVVARGPAVVGGEAALEIIGMIRDDHTLAYLRD